MHRKWRSLLTLPLVAQSLLPASVSGGAITPAKYDSIQTNSTASTPSTEDVEEASDNPGYNTTSYKAAPSDGYRNVGYFVDWAIYARNFQPMDLPADKYTHILYAFANLHKDTGEVYWADSYADTDKHYPSDSWSETGNNVYGCIKQMYMLKQKNRNMKVMLSIGGYTYSPQFSGAAGSEANRAKFVESSMKLLKDAAFDGLDIDWEYPASDDDKKNFVSLLTSLRQAMDSYSDTLPDKPHFYLSVASPAGPQNFPYLDFAAMDAQLDYWNLMAYDYAGSFSDMSGYQDNIYNSSNYPEGTPFNTDVAVQHYIKNGVTASKINLGMPLYGRQFVGTEGPGKNYSGVGQGSWQDGIWDYKALPRPGATINYDDKAQATWSYDESSQTMVTYDDVNATNRKLEYIKTNGLGGGMWWETSADKPIDHPDSLVMALVNGFGGTDNLMMTKNNLDYPDSQYDNIKNKMGGGSNSTSS